MHNLLVDRRRSRINSLISNEQDISHIVRQGMLIQAFLGTRGAVEFLKVKNVHGTIIHRALTGESVRKEDNLELENTPGKQYFSSGSLATC